MAPWHAVVFDYYYTLANPDPTSIATLTAFLAKHVATMTLDEFHHHRAQVPPAPAEPFRTYRARWHAFGDEFFAGHGAPGLGDAYATSRHEAHATAPLYDDTPPTLHALRQHGVAIGVLSDADCGHLFANIERHGLAFDAVLCSEQLGCYKPDPRAFTAICDAVSVEPSTTLFVGDGPETDVDGARNAGLQAIWLNRSSNPWPAHLPPPARMITSLAQLVAEPQ
jgi:putative hydrolase of the HAD superfamily